MPNIKLSQIPKQCGCSKLSKILSYNCLLNIFTILSITVFSANSKILEHCGLFNSFTNTWKLACRSFVSIHAYSGIMVYAAVFQNFTNISKKDKMIESCPCI